MRCHAVALVVLSLLAFVAPLRSPAAPAQDHAGPGVRVADGAPVRVFAKLDGTWTGTFVGYDASGRELYRIAVRQTYRTIDETTQRVTISDTMPDGTVILGEGENVARRRPDGTLALTCVVRKSSGERVTHDGRLVKGPDGDEQFIWYSDEGGPPHAPRPSASPSGARRMVGCTKSTGWAGTATP